MHMYTMYIHPRDLVALIFGGGGGGGGRAPPGKFYFLNLLHCSTSLVEEGNVVRLRGLPYQASMKQVAGFLSGLNIIP